MSDSILAYNMGTMWDFKTIFGLVFIAAGTYEALWCVYKGWQGLRSMRWPSVYGQVLDSNIDRRSEQGEGFAVEYCPRIWYRYQVGGTEYENPNGRHLLIEEWGTKEKADFALRRFASLDQVRVYYNPTRPSQSVLERGIAQSYIWLFVLSCLLIVIGLYMAGLF